MGSFRDALASLLNSVTLPFRVLGTLISRLPFWTLLLAGLGLSIALAPFTSWTHDVYPFYNAAVDLMGGLNPYSSSIYTYPPLFAYLLFAPTLGLGFVLDPSKFAELIPQIAAAAEITEMITPTITSPLFNLVLKLPLIAAHAGIAILLFAIVSRRFGTARGKVAFALWIFNPLVIWVTVLQGQFDVIPAFLTLASTFLLVKRSYLFAGLALGLATLFKFYPLFLVVPLILLIVGLERSRLMAHAVPKGRPARGASVFILGNALILLALAVPLLTTPFLELTIIRRSQFPIVGGFQPFFILMLDIWERIGLGRLVIPTLTGPLFVGLLAFPLVISLLVGLILFRRKGLSISESQLWPTVALLTVVPLVALYSALPLVNPQHLLWVLPFLILATAIWRRLLVPTFVISLAGLAFLLSLQGVAVFFYPLAVFTSILSVEGIQAQVVGYWNLPGLVSTRLQMDLLALASGIGYVTLVLAAYLVMKAFFVSPVAVRVPAPAPTNPAPLPRVERSLRVTVTAVVVFLVASQGFILVQDVPAPATVEGVVSNPSLGTVSVDLRGHTLFPSSYRVTVLALGAAPQALPLYLYHDDAYPISNTSAPRIFGLIDHLRSELARARMPMEIRLVDAASLASLLAGPPAILVMTTTAWPATVLPDQPTLVRQWLEGGGLLIWSGALLGVYAGREDGETLDLRKAYPTQPWGPSVILGFDPIQVGGPNRTSAPGPWEAALDIRFPYATWGARVSEIEAQGGLALGRLTAEVDPKASLSLFPVGAGTVAIFGDALGPVFTYSAEDVVAHDIARLLLSGLLFNPSGVQATLLGSAQVALGPGQRERVVLPAAMPPGASHLVVLAFSEVDHDPLLRAIAVLP